MKRISITLLLSIFCGAVGFYFRHRQLLTGYEATGLAIPNNLWSLLLIAFSLLVLAACLLLIFQCVQTPGTYAEAFAARGHGIYLVFSWLSAFLLIISTAIRVSTLLISHTSYAWIEWIRCVLCIIAAFCFIAVSTGNFFRTGLGSSGERSYSLALLAFPYMCCLWLITAFQSTSSNPVISKYIYYILSIICILVATYCVASFSFKRPKPKLCLLFSLMGIYLSIVTLADSHTWSERLLLLASILYLAQSAMILMIRTRAPEEPEEPEESPASAAATNLGGIEP